MRLTAALLVLSAVAMNLAFTVLGTVFDYPDVLTRPTAQILTAFRAEQTHVTIWFTVMATAAATFAPIAIRIGRLAPMRAAVAAGIAAAVVQTIGLLRWPLLVPHFAATGDVAAFELAHRVLGTLLGEALGYALTAGWTILVLRALPGLPRWFHGLGALSAAMIATGILTPLGVPLTDLGNFVGYVLWSGWLICFAGLLLRRSAGPETAPQTTVEPCQTTTTT